MTRIFSAVVVGLVASLVAAPAALACGFLVSANGAVQLGKTTTFVAWEDGIEHYITNFTFEGPAESFGSLIPLPAEPTTVTRAGDWTLQRLQREVAPLELTLLSAQSARLDSAEDVEVILRTRIDSLDLVVLKGGGAGVLAWVNENGFSLPPGPETDHMLDFYASRSPYFLAARFDADAAAQDDFVAGDGIPVQITIPTPQPWVPLHILHGAIPDSVIIEADVFLLTPERPNLLYGEGLTIERSEWASDLLLDDLRSDENMEWVPDEGWFTYLKLETEAENVTYDLSVGVGSTPPSFVDAGFMTIEPTPEHLEAVGLEWILDVAETPDLELTTEQIEALGFEQATPWWQDGATGALLAVIAGMVGATLVLVVGRSKSPETAAQEPERVTAGV
jgi:hypothetical protein